MISWATFPVPVKIMPQKQITKSLHQKQTTVQVSLRMLKTVWFLSVQSISGTGGQLQEWWTKNCFYNRCFQDILSDPVQLECFKRYLMKEHEETPLQFWQAVESMRTTSKTGKARQGRTYGIIRRYFGPSTNHGE